MMFYPNADVKREELAAMTYRYAKYQGYNRGKTSDLSGLENADKVSKWATDAMKWAVGTEIISGIEVDGIKDLAPQGNATRAQIAAIIQRTCKEYSIEMPTTSNIF